MATPAAPTPAPPGTCCNCGTALQGPYCHACGQHDANARRPGGFISEAFEELTDYDSKVFRTLGALLWRPARLSLAYVNGQRVRYAPPLRLFLNLGVVALLLVSLSSEAGFQVNSTNAPGKSFLDIPIDSLTQQEYREQMANAQARKDTARLRRLQASPDSGRAQVDLAGISPSFERELRDKVRKSTPRQLAGSVLDRLPVAMFLLLPLAAVLHWGFFFRRYRHYVPHLVFNLHVHAFAFAVFIPILLSNWVELPGIGDELLEVSLALLLFTIPVYYLVAVRRFYHTSWGGLVWRGTLVGFLYLVCVTFAAIGLFILAIWLM